MSGWKKKRYDPLSKTLPTKLFNWATRRMSGVKLHDFNCGLKAYRGEVVKHIGCTGNATATSPSSRARKATGRSGKGGEAPPARVWHHQVRAGPLHQRFLDLLTIAFVFRFGRKPMHFFGALGTLMFVLGLVAAAWVVGSKLWTLFVLHQPTALVTDRALFFVASPPWASACTVHGRVRGRAVSRNAPDRNAYRVAAVL